MAAIQQLWRQALWSHAKDKLQDNLQASEILFTCVDRHPAGGCNCELCQSAPCKLPWETCRLAAKFNFYGDALQLPDGLLCQAIKFPLCWCFLQLPDELSCYSRPQGAKHR